MTPRSGLIVGAALAALVALVLAFVPADWLAGLLNVSGADATSFLVRRYGASATAALFVSTAAIVLALLSWSFTTLAVAAKNVMTSVPTYMMLETGFTVVQFAVVGPLIALAYRA